MLPLTRPTTNTHTIDAKNGIPWVEKYRPAQFDDIVLDPVNRRIFRNILDKKYFPNLLFYGPPGTGKTTSIINIINEYQSRYGNPNQGSVVHLNASDERGIDTIRNQIYQFVKSKNFFETGLKFVILDEVDYMTKNAQQALKYLLQSCLFNVRFCLICNYISKIDESLKNEFISIRFNQLPKKDIHQFIRNVADKENIEIRDSTIDVIQKLYSSDIRSMINFIQLNQYTDLNQNIIITDAIYDTLHTFLHQPEKENGEIIQYIHDISIQYNTDKRTIVKNYFHFVIRNLSHFISRDFLNISEIVIHNVESDIQYTLLYFIYKMKNYYATFSNAKI